MTREKPDLHPDDAAWLEGLMAKSKLGPDEEEDLDRVNQLATVAARRAAEALRGLLPDVLVDIFACDIGDVLVSHPLVFETFAAESVDWAHPHLTPDEESEGHLISRSAVSLSRWARSSVSSSVPQICSRRSTGCTGSSSSLGRGWRPTAPG